MAAEVKVDRRVRRTRQLLREALLALIVEKGYEHVSVQDILDRADVGRSTFYAHYRDKEELLLSGFDESFAAFVETTISASDNGRVRFLEPALVLFQHADGHRHIWKALVGKQSSEVVLRYLREHLAEVISQHLRQQINNPVADELVFAATVQYTVNALIGVLAWWTETDAPYTPEELHRLFVRLSSTGIKRSLALAN
jgi:AcrR family transcriptional regulator